MKKPFEPSFNLIRAVSAIMIVYVHYSYCYAEYGIMNGPGFLMFKNGDIGGVFVTMFFMLSGAALLYNHPRIPDLKSLKDFYIKRWLNIFPSFYIAWTVMYIINSRKMGGWFWGGVRKKFLLSFFGIDGYFLHLGMNYYCLGEWFLGAIIILYLLYPLLLFLWNRARIPSTLVLVFLFLFNLRRHFFSSWPDINIFIVFIKYYNSHITISDNMCLWTCALDFWCGFILVTYALPFLKKLQNDEKGRLTKMSLIAFVLIFICLLLFFTVELPFNKQETSVIMAFLFYLLFTVLTPLVPKGLTNPVNLISKYSYPVFLVHHVMIYAILDHFRNIEFTRATSLLMFIPVYAVVFAVGYVLSKITGAVLKAAEYPVKLVTGKKR